MRLRSAALLIILSFIALSAQARVLVKGHKGKSVIVQSSDPNELSKGMVLTAESVSGETCEVHLIQVKGRLGAARASDCSFQLKAGQQLSTEGPMMSDFSSKKSSSKKSSMRIGGQIFYDLTNSLDSQVTISSQSTQTTYNTVGALGFGARFEMDIATDIGLVAGFNYELDRKIDSSTSGGTTTAITDLTYGLMYFEANGTYSFGPIYAIAGGNYSLPSLTGTSAANTTVAGGLGLQIGAGYKITDMFGVEALYKTINQTITYTSGSISVENDYDRLWGFMIRGTVLFDL